MGEWFDKFISKFRDYRSPSIPADLNKLDAAHNQGLVEYGKKLAKDELYNNIISVPLAALGIVTAAVCVPLGAAISITAGLASLLATSLVINAVDILSERQAKPAVVAGNGLGDANLRNGNAENLQIPSYWHELGKRTMRTFSLGVGFSLIAGLAAVGGLYAGGAASVAATSYGYGFIAVSATKDVAALVAGVSIFSVGKVTLMTMSHGINKALISFNVISEPKVVDPKKVAEEKILELMLEIERVKGKNMVLQEQIEREKSEKGALRTELDNVIGANILRDDGQPVMTKWVDDSHKPIANIDQRRL